MYGFLIAEKVNRVIVVGVAAMLVILLQLFHGAWGTPQDIAFKFVANNISILWFIIGMVTMIGIVKKSGFFEYIALKLIKAVKGHPIGLLIALGYLTWLMTTFLSNIPTVLILTPIVLILVRQLKLPSFPYFFCIITMANISWAMTPISDPTTLYQAQTVGLSFMEVVQNSGMLVMILTVVVMLYCYFVFRKQLNAVPSDKKFIYTISPWDAISDRRLMYIWLPLLGGIIVMMVLKDWIISHTGMHFDNATLALTGALIMMIVSNTDPKEVFTKIIDREVLFFFMGLFIVVGALEHTEVIKALALQLVSFAWGSMNILLFLMTMGSGILSTFIDNVPYNITMVGAVQEMANTGLVVYPLRWALNLWTSLGGAGSPIGAACNVVCLWEAEKDHIHYNFLSYLAYGVPLVVINALVVYGVLYLKYIW
jgi:Na+/H+ antiporter NhaD/arsenite permease-like protein